jgi:predicted O-methyltransferase YrrM
MKHWNEIQGWFNYQDTFNFLLDKTPENGRFVECGAWLGSSTAYLCDEAIKKNINVYVVDSWKGSQDELYTNHKLATQTDIYPIFLSNMGHRKFIPIRKLSHEASLDFEDSSCDVVFIDMEHTYHAVKQDIQCWLPKVKAGGYIAGHDYALYALGLMQAVQESFGKDNIQSIGNCWIVKKEEV